MANKTQVEKFISESDELRAIELLKSSVMQITRIYKAREKASTKAFETTKERRGARGGARTRIDANHQAYCEQYEASKKDFFEYVEVFKKHYG